MNYNGEIEHNSMKKGEKDSMSQHKPVGKFQGCERDSDQ